MEQKKREKSAKKKAEREAFLDKLENTKISDLLKMQENPRIVQLRKFVCAAGLRCNYKQTLKDCTSDEEKIDKIEAFMASKGLKVKEDTTIERCRKFKLKKERERELADLDLGNIITEKGRSLRSGGGIPRRGAHTKDDSSDSEEEGDTTGHKETQDKEEDSSTKEKEISGDEKEEEEEEEPRQEFKQIFSGLKGFSRQKSLCF